jgi:hypothetical protein
MCGGKDDSVHPFAPEHLNMLLFGGKIRMGTAEDNVIP